MHLTKTEELRGGIFYVLPIYLALLLFCCPSNLSLEGSCAWGSKVFANSVAVTVNRLVSLVHHCSLWQCGPLLKTVASYIPPRMNCWIEIIFHTFLIHVWFACLFIDQDSQGVLHKMVLSDGYYTTAVVFGGTFAVSYLIVWIRGSFFKPKHRYPPCLPWVPIIGSMPFLPRFPQMYSFFTTRKHGGVVGFYLTDQWSVSQ